MTVKDMELIRYEKYDYVLIVCRNEIDYKNLQGHGYLGALGLQLIPVGRQDGQLRRDVRKDDIDPLPGAEVQEPVDVVREAQNPGTGRLVR